MDENKVLNPEVEENKENTEATTDNSVVEENVTNDTVEAKEESTDIPPEGEGATMDGASAMGALGGLLGGMLGGAAGNENAGDGYKNIIKDQIELFTRFEKDISDLKMYNESMQAHLTFTKKYIQYLTKAIIISDIVLIFMIIGLIIFK